MDFERIPVTIVPEYADIAGRVARDIASLIRQRADEGRPAVLGLATGSTPIGIYRELIRMHREDGLDFSGVIAFNLDEYYPMEPGSIHSYHRFMRENLFAHVNIDPANIHIPRGDIARADIEAHGREYEAAIRAAGGIDYQILGIGKTGHIGFNEPGSGRETRTRRVALDTLTRRDAAADFFGEENVPTEAITMGIATILEAKEIALIATGEHKAAIVQRAVEGEVSRDVAATWLQGHPHARVWLDTAASAELTRIRTPWIVGEVHWTRSLEIRAVIWLSQVTGKSVLKLDATDYRENHLSPLLAKYGSPGPLNGEVFNALISKIRGRSKLPTDRRIVVFSPHPDDDVISMGGLLNKLHQNGNEITVAYQTSGNIAVFDHEVRRYIEFLRRFADGFGTSAGSAATDAVERALAAKNPGDVDDPAVQQLKRIIRESEAISGIETFGMTRDQAVFLNLPFYQTGKVRKDPVGDADVAIVRDVIERCRPHMIFVAGDLSDPHGTHRMCKEAIDRALREYEDDPPEMWLYRGAWQEWPIAEADVLIPLSEDELRLKILAIFKHQSQKDRAPFPGLDDREFWQRVEARNRGTAAEVDRLGLPEYFAMESYVVRREGQPLVQPHVPTSGLRSGPVAVLASMLLAGALSLAGPPPVAAQAVPCDPALAAPDSNPWGYRVRGDRCEGVYAQPVAGTPLIIASFTERFDTYDPTATTNLVLRWAARAPGAIRLRALALRRRLYYRMDAEQPAAAGSWAWPTDLLAALELERPELGVVAWTPRTIGATERDVHVPLRIIDRGAADTAADYSLVLLPQVELTEVYVTVALIGQDGRAVSYLRDEEPLGYGYYPAARPIEITVARPESLGLYRVLIGARIRSGGSLATELWFERTPD